MSVFWQRWCIVAKWLDGSGCHFDDYGAREWLAEKSSISYARRILCLSVLGLRR